jgi:hypothetical protein
MSINRNNNNDSNEALSGVGSGTQIRRNRLFSYSYFKYGYNDGKEINFRAGKFSLRIARHQFAFWINSKPIFNLLF